MRTMLLNIFILLSGLNSFTLFAEEKVSVVKVAYFNKIFGHVHQNPSRYSQSMSTIACAHPLKVVKVETEEGNSTETFAQDWKRVQTGPYDGYVPEKYLSDKKPSCFQDRYPKFFESMELELTDMYYWGRLYDHYDQGHSKVGQ